MDSEYWHTKTGLNSNYPPVSCKGIWVLTHSNRVKSKLSYKGFGILVLTHSNRVKSKLSYKGIWVLTHSNRVKSKLSYKGIDTTL